MDWDIVIGLETHVQLLTKSKIFSRGGTRFGQTANTEIDFVDLGLPGVLPVVNKKALESAILFGVSVKGKISEETVFSRKNYFYPDLPKGYQISQLDKPIVLGGSLEVILDSKKSFTVPLTRAHLEEDAGKSSHEGFGNFKSGIDYNRAGIALLEIVSEPSMSSADEAVAYAKCLHNLVTWIGICDGNMQEGSFRCDANVSVRPKGEAQLGTRAELKNINSFRFVERAIYFEIDRQIGVIEDGGSVVQETRLYDPDKDLTRSMRGKEEAHDYRYFPDPDLPPLVITKKELDAIRSEMPELPDAKLTRLASSYELSNDDAALLAADSDLADFFEAAVKAANGESRLIANWILGDLSSALNRESLSISESPVSPEMLGQLINRIKDNTISGKIAKQVFGDLWHGKGQVDDIIRDQGLTQITDTDAISKAVDDVITAFPSQVDQVRAGEEKVIGFLVGQVMKATSGKANPQAVNNLIKTKLSS